MLYVKKQGKNHKGEDIVKLYSRDCPICSEYMVYFEFIFNINPIADNSDVSKLIKIQQIDALIEKVTKGDKVDIMGVLLGCPICYTSMPKAELDKRVDKKPYIILDAEDIFNISSTNISHVYLAQPY